MAPNARYLRAVSPPQVKPEQHVQVPQALTPSHLGGTEGLSPKERELLHLAAWGYTNYELAAMLVVSVKVIEGRKSRGMKKLNLHTGHELVRYAVRNGWFEVEP